jgi:two-component system phosphate regulon response regulator OmpR
MGEGPAHLLVVDDDTRLRALLQRYLTASGFRVTTASDAADARAKLAAMSYDLLVVDVMMPGEPGTDFLASLRKTDQVPVLMLTAMNEAGDRIKGLESGADDYLPKPFEPQELVLRIGAILRRARAPAAGARPVRFGEFVFDAGKGELLRAGAPVRLTAGEMALLRVLARNPGATVARAALAEGAGAGAGRAVDVQITRLRRKIESDPKAPRHLRTVWGEGYVLWVE